MSSFTAGRNDLRDEADRLARENGGLLGPSREEAEAIVRARGHTVDPATGASTYAPPQRDASEYAAIPDQVARGIGAGLQLDPMMARAVGDDIAAGKVHPNQVKAEAARIGDNYDELVKAVDAMLGPKVIGVRAVELPFWSLKMLAAVAGVRAKYEGQGR